MAETSLTLSVVGVERSMSETAKRTSKAWIIGAWDICDAQRRGTQGRAHIWVVFSCKGGERGEWRGPKGRADEPIFGGVWSKTPILPSSSRHRVFPKEPIRHTVVACPISSHSIAANRITTFPCAYTVRNCSKIINNDGFLENRK